MNQTSRNSRQRDVNQISSDLRSINSVLKELAQLTTDPEIRRRLETAQEHVELGLEELDQDE